ncbi:MAG: DUF4212 domain-containing protein [Bacteroidales bacterium]|nr:DUF4212 domain-containing protein [Bacteroidales bacterium]
MKDSDNGYHISFFKPTTERARHNRGIVIWLTSIWFIAIFGFQIALRVLEKPTPEPPLLAFENVWDNIVDGTADKQDLQTFARSTLYVLGKIAIDEDERALLSGSMSWSAFLLVPDTLRSVYAEDVRAFGVLKDEKSHVGEASYVMEKNRLSEKFSLLIGLENSDPLTRILPLELTVKDIGSLPSEAADKLPSVMQKYLIHNQSFLTDAQFLGFPFHYFYTSVFLLILFIGLCWLYCIRSDRRNALLGIED